MGVFRVLRIFVCLMSAATVAGGLFYWDTNTRRQRATEFALSLTKQTAAQAEALYLEARSHGDADPVGRAAKSLSLGAEPRFLRVTAIPRGVIPRPREGFTFDAKTGSLELVRIFSPENGLGVRVTLQQAYPGFLGTTSKFFSEASAALVFLIVFFLTGIPVRRFSDREMQNHLQQVIRLWLPEAKNTLLQLGVSVKDFLKNAQIVIDAGNRAKEAMTAMHAQISGDVESVRAGAELLGKMEKGLARAEVISMNLALAGRKFGPNGKPFAELAAQLHRSLQEIHQIHRDNFERIAAFHQNVIPLIEKVSQGTASHEELTRAATALNDRAKVIMSSIMTEAKLIQDLKNRSA